MWICHNKGLFSIVNYVDQNDRRKETGEVLESEIVRDDEWLENRDKEEYEVLDIPQEGKLYTRKYMGIARTKIWSSMARMNYMLEYFIK